ncbi:hypothetical protein EDC18_103303 [Natranaerovirga pectinivora]|uniref:Uncharacterized protein n=1 Tax=Natranaerovirga pectinivora TaxID=682400 RepID=A0A4R3MMV6_9FIRM|nr:hypothetical protein [Natranaerovirga pectinivora]TCT15595.1 hypothetical protein EDC18_103303 [Natranaerovirga pectinivora]
MKNKALKMIAMILILATLNTLLVLGCWPYFSSEELIEKSEVILIGRLNGNISEEQVKYESTIEIWITKWEIEVEQVIKGNVEESSINIVTTGAENKGITLSTSYRLDTTQEYVLLFLISYGEDYQPITPQGVKYITVGDKDNREDLYKRYNIFPEELQEELEDYILENEIAFDLDKEEEDKEDNKLLYGVTSVSLIGSYLLIKKRKK